MGRRNSTVTLDTGAAISMVPRDPAGQPSHCSSSGTVRDNNGGSS